MPHRHLVFDVNETLLDLAPLDPVFESLFGSADARERWFANLLHWSTVTTLTGEYRDFSQLAEELGYARLWVYDSPALYGDVWITLARTAEATERIGLGTGVMVPHLRHVLVTASALASVDEASSTRTASTSCPERAFASRAARSPDSKRAR